MNIRFRKMSSCVVSHYSELRTLLWCLTYQKIRVSKHKIASRNETFDTFEILLFIQPGL